MIKHNNMNLTLINLKKLDYFFLKYEFCFGAVPLQFNP